MHVFKDKLFLPVALDIAWQYFSDPRRLAEITPEGMDFKIISEIPDCEIYQGQKIQYSVKPMLGIPMKWETLIAGIDKPYSFTDMQLKGPYELWEHKHTFEKKDDGVLMTDIVHYKLPWGVVGNIAEKLFVRKRIEFIFKHRKKILKEIFNINGTDPA